MLVIVYVLPSFFRAAVDPGWSPVLLSRRSIGLPDSRQAADLYDSMYSVMYGLAACVLLVVKSMLLCVACGGAPRGTGCLWASCEIPDLSDSGT